MDVVAEGVEEVAALRYLKKIDCDIAQGYYLAKPMPHEQIMSWFVKFPGVDPNKL